MKQTRLMINLFALALMVTALASPALAQPGGGRDRMMGFGGGDNMIGLLLNPRVQEELELVDDQVAELEGLRESMMERTRDLFSGMRDMDPEERETKMAEMREKMQEEMKSLEKEVEAVLLPHQMTRLKQISYQSSGQRRGAGGSLSNERLLDELGVTEEQKKELEEKAEEVRAKLQEKYRKMVADAEDEILGVLSESQRSKYKELIGEPFDTQSMFGGFGGQGGRGGRGGQGEGGPGGRGGRGGQGGQPRSDF